jgi:glycosyltransferase involved in cell wall biosynthesis
MPSLSCFFPCYNDAFSIAPLVANANAVAAAFTDDYEIIVIDDGSRDHSREVLRDLAETYPHLKLIFHDQNRGYGGALQSGFKAATKEWVFYTDGDGQYDVWELRNLLAEIQADVDVVNGYKVTRSDAWYRLLIGKMYLGGMRLLFGFRVRDVDCDFRLIRKSVLDRIALRHTSGVICVELVVKLEQIGARFVNVPVHHYERQHGSSQFFRWRHLMRTLVQVVALWWGFRK